MRTKHVAQLVHAPLNKSGWLIHEITDSGLAVAFITDINKNWLDVQQNYPDAVFLSYAILVTTAEYRRLQEEFTS